MIASIWNEGISSLTHTLAHYYPPILISPVPMESLSTIDV